MTEYGYKEVAEILGVSLRTAQRYVKEAGVQGTLSYRPEGGTKRVFTDLDMERLKVFVTPLDLPIKAPPSGMTSGMTSGVTEPDSGRGALAVLLDLRTLLENLVTANEELREELRQREERHTAELAAIRAELIRHSEATRRREENLAARLEALQEEVSRPWWAKLWTRWGRKND